MKKIIALLLALVMVLALAACTPKETQQTEKQTENTETKQETSKQETEKKQEGTSVKEMEQNNQAETNTKTEATDTNRGGIMKMAWPSMGDSWDAHAKASWTTFIWAQPIYEGVLALGVDGVIYPNVCDYELSADGLQVKLWVVEGKQFSDGTPVVIDDVLASLQRTAKYIAKFNTNFWDYVKDFEIKDGVLTFNFSSYNPNVMFILSEPRPYNGIMKKAICEKYADTQIMDLNDVIGTGPYKLVPAETEKDVKVTYVRNDNYLISEASADNNGCASPKRQYLDSIVLTFINDTSATLMSAMAGDQDIIQATPTDMDALKPYHFNFWSSFSGTAFYAFFNCSESRITANADLRKAVAAAIDDDEATFSEYDQYFDNTMHSPAYVGDAYDTNDLFRAADYIGAANVELSKKYQQAAGYNGEEIKLLCVAGKNYPLVIQARCQAAGLNVVLQEVDQASINDYWGSVDNDWDFCVRPTAVSTTLASAIDTTFHTFWCNDEIEAKLADLKGMVTDSAESTKLWAEISQAMADECPFYILSYTSGDSYAYEDGLHLNWNGTLRYFYNAYWDKPADHME